MCLSQLWSYICVLELTIKVWYLVQWMFSEIGWRITICLKINFLQASLILVVHLEFQHVSVKMYVILCQPIRETLVCTIHAVQCCRSTLSLCLYFAKIVTILESNASPNRSSNFRIKCKKLIVCCFLEVLCKAAVSLQDKLLIVLRFSSAWLVWPSSVAIRYLQKGLNNSANQRNSNQHPLVLLFY